MAVAYVYFFVQIRRFLLALDKIDILYSVHTNSSANKIANIKSPKMIVFGFYILIARKK